MPEWRAFISLIQPYPDLARAGGIRRDQVGFNGQEIFDGPPKVAFQTYKNPFQSPVNPHRIPADPTKSREIVNHKTRDKMVPLSVVPG